MDFLERPEFARCYDNRTFPTIIKYFRWYQPLQRYLWNCQGFVTNDITQKVHRFKILSKITRNIFYFFFLLPVIKLPTKNNTKNEGTLRHTLTLATLTCEEYLLPGKSNLLRIYLWKLSPKRWLQFIILRGSPSLPSLPRGLNWRGFQATIHSFPRHHSILLLHLSRCW